MLRASIEDIQESAPDLDMSSLGIDEDDSMIDELEEHILNAINMTGEELYDLRYNRLTPITEDMTRRRFNISDIAKSLTLKRKGMTVSLSLIEKDHFEIPLWKKTRDAITLLLPYDPEHDDGEYVLIARLGKDLAYYSKHLRIYANHELADLRINNCIHPVVNLHNTSSGRLGNNLTSLLSDIGAIYRDGVIVTTGGQRLVLKGGDPVFVVANLWYMNIPDVGSKTNDKFNLLKPDGLYSNFHYLCKTYYSNATMLSYRYQNSMYSGFLHDPSAGLDAFIGNVLLPAVSHHLRRKDAPNDVIHVHLRQSDYCYQSEPFPVLHFDYYKRALSGVLRGKDTIVIFCPPEDRLAANLLKIYLSDLPHPIKFDHEAYPGLKGLDVNYWMSNGCDRLVTSNSTFSLLSVALAERNPKVTVSPIIEVEYGVITVDEISINGMKIANRREKAGLFDCAIRKYGYMPIIYMFVLKNSGLFPQMRREMETMRNYMHALKGFTGIWKKLQGDISQLGKFLEDVPECERKECIQAFIDGLKHVRRTRLDLDEGKMEFLDVRKEFMLDDSDDEGEDEEEEGEEEEEEDYEDAMIPKYNYDISGYSPLTSKDLEED